MIVDFFVKVCLTGNQTRQNAVAIIKACTGFLVAFGSIDFGSFREKCAK